MLQTVKSRDRTDGKCREGLIPLRNLDPGYNGCRGRDFTCVVRRKDVFADGLGDGIGIRLRGNCRLATGENLFGHILFWHRIARNSFLR